MLFCFIYQLCSSVDWVPNSFPLLFNISFHLILLFLLCCLWVLLFNSHLKTFLYSINHLWTILFFSGCIFLNSVFSLFLKDFIYLFLEREGEKYQCVVASHVAPTGDLSHNPGMCPDWELNQWPVGSQPALSPLSYTSKGDHLVFWYFSYSQ